MIHETSVQLNTSLSNISNVPINFRDVADVRTSLNDQTQVHNNLQSFSQQVNDIITRGTEVMRLPMVPKYVQQDVQNIQKVYNDKIQSAKDLLDKFQVKELF